MQQNLCVAVSQLSHPCDFQSVCYSVYFACYIQAGDGKTEVNNERNVCDEHKVVQKLKMS